LSDVDILTASERRWPLSIKKRHRQFRALIGALGDDLEGVGTIYHYTSAQGLRGIIQKGELWLTNTAFVNDTTECRALWRLRDLFRKGELTNRFVRERWESRLHPHAGVSDRDDGSTLYIASFSEEGSSLDQWRAYGAFCIGFDGTKMVRKGFKLHKCVYTEDDIRDWILQKSSLREWEGNCLGDAEKRVAAGNLLNAASTKYKSDYYRGEKELRVTAVSNHTWEPYADSPAMFERQPPMHFRDHPAYKIPVPYVKFFVPSPGTQTKWYEETQRKTPMQWKRRRLKKEDKADRGLLPITEIVIGPMARREEAELACKIMLKEKGYEDVPVQVPNIPYRGV
jgi:hypothetical protein